MVCRTAYFPTSEKRLEFKSFVIFPMLSFERNLSLTFIKIPEIASHEGEMLTPLQMHDTMDESSDSTLELLNFMC